MLHHDLYRRGVISGIVPIVLFCSFCVGLLLIGCGRPCTAVACGSTLVVNFKVSVPQTYDVEVSVPQGQRFSLHCAGNSTNVTANTFPEGQAGCLWNEGLQFYNFTPSEVTVRLISGNLRATQTFHPTYNAYQVNGPGCGPDCRSATAAFTTPLDTSPQP
jgi:hypothetical protein